MDNLGKNNGVNKIVINWYPGHMAKTKREVVEKLRLVDIIFEVVDARMPKSSKIVDIDEWTKGKPRILIMTKYDLCDKKETDKFIDYYKSLGYSDVICLNLLTDKVDSVISSSKSILKNANLKRESKGLKPRSVRALVLGVPNVGKSTLINRLVGKRSVPVGNKPGVTRNLSWIRINKDIELMDSPGVLWPRLDDQNGAKTLASFSSIKEEILDINLVATFILETMYKYYPDELYKRYGIKSLSSDFTREYDVIAHRRGVLSRGGEVDYLRVSNIILNDLRSGKLGCVTFDRLKEG